MPMPACATIGLPRHVSVSVMGSVWILGPAAVPHLRTCMPFLVLPYERVCLININALVGTTHQPVQVLVLPFHHVYWAWSTKAPIRPRSSASCHLSQRTGYTSQADSRSQATIPGSCDEDNMHGP